MSPDGIYQKIRNHFDEAGFNLTVKIRAEDFNSTAAGKKSGEFLEGARSIIVTGFGGRGFWETFNRFLARNPEFIAEHENPVDDYTRRVFRDLEIILGTSGGGKYRTVFPFGKDALDLDFVKLGLLGGVGVPSLLGILLNPVYGSWISLRGALLTELEFKTYDEPMIDFSPCPSCDKPCISACPAHTISENGWDWEACMKHRLSTYVCSEKCASRLSCPYGQEHSYTPDQIIHHHKFVLKSVKEYFGEK